MSLRQHTCIITTVFISVWGCVATAADTQPSDDTVKAGTQARVVATVQFSKAEFEELVGQMLELAQLLEKNDPQTAQTLRHAVTEAQRAFISQDMDEVTRLLTGGLATTALKHETRIGQKLRHVLETLRLGIIHPEDREKRLESYRKALDGVRSLLNKQKELAENYRLGKSDSDAVAKVQEISKQVGELAQRQKKLLTQAEKLPAADDQLNRSKELSDLYRKLAEVQLKLAEDAKNLSDKAGETTENARLTQAISEMQNAGQSLGRNDRKSAIKAMKRALQKLSDKEYVLAQLQRRLPEIIRTPKDVHASQQEELRKRTQEAARQMKGGEKSQNLPGQDNVANAGSQMDKAKSGIEKEHSDQAAESQDEAIRQLSKAEEELQEAIAREEQMKQLDALVHLDKKLKDVLDKQKKLSKATKALDAKRQDVEKLSRLEQLELQRLGEQEKELAKEVGVVSKKVEKEKTTVFPEVLRQMERDLTRISQRLLAKDAGAKTQQLQADVEAMLESMLESLAKEMNERKRNMQRGGGGGGGGGKLVSMVNELKLLRTLQMQIHKRTQELNTNAKGGQNDKVEQEYKTLAGRQARVRKIAEKLAEKVRAERKEEGKGQAQ